MMIQIKAAAADTPHLPVFTVAHKVQDCTPPTMQPSWVLLLQSARLVNYHPQTADLEGFGYKLEAFKTKLAYMHWLRLIP